MKHDKPFCILLAGIGADGHCVGLHLLRDALGESGYAVTFLGVRNEVQDVVARAGDYDAVMISVMDGHARHYLEAYERPPTGPVPRYS